MVALIRLLVNRNTTLAGFLHAFGLGRATHDHGPHACKNSPAPVGLWVSYRVVNYAKFADFLIAVEAEMNKVSWPSRRELVRSSIVVIVVIFLMVIVLTSFDILWRWLFQLIGVLR